MNRTRIDRGAYRCGRFIIVDRCRGVHGRWKVGEPLERPETAAQCLSVPMVSGSTSYHRTLADATALARLLEVKHAKQ